MRLSLVAMTAVLLLAESLALAADPTTADCLAANEASLKLRHDHKLRAERSQLLVCAAESCPADVRKECLSRVAEVNGQIPTVIFGAKDASGADLSAVKVTMDGEVLSERLEGTALSIDPGQHTFVFETAGQAPVTKTLLIQQAEKDRRESVSFGTPTNPPLQTCPDGYELPPSGGSCIKRETNGLGTQKVLAIVAGGVGVVGLGVGTVAGLVAVSQKSAAQSACPGSWCATQDGSNKWSTAGSTANLSTIGFIVGGVGVAAGAVLWLTAPSAPSTQVGFGPGGLQVKGTW